jgi:uncharacterized membrane protein
MIPSQTRAAGDRTEPAGGAERPRLHIAPDLSALIAAAPARQPQRRRSKRRNLNEIVHGVLVVGLAASTLCMLVGIAFALADRRQLPSSVPGIGDVLSRAVALRPSGFLGLGLLILIATPILRVIGSIGAFLYERDWRFAGMTTLVLAVLAASLVLGHG